MSTDKPMDKTPQEAFVEKLFGDVADLQDEELDLLFEAAAPGVEPLRVLGEIAERVAKEQRSAGKVPPEHVQAALKATKAQRQGAANKKSIRERVREAIESTLPRPVAEPALSFRNQKDLTERDKQALEALEKEIDKGEGDK